MIDRTSRRKIFKWTVAATIALIATRLFFVQELIAVFVIFSILFACLAGVVLIVFLLEHAAQTALDWVEVYVRAFGRASRRNSPHHSAGAQRSRFERHPRRRAARIANCSRHPHQRSGRSRARETGRQSAAASARHRETTRARC